MAPPVENPKVPNIIDQYFYRAKLPFPQRPNGILSGEKRGLRYQVKFDEKEAFCDLSPFPGLCSDSIEEAKKTWEELFSKHLEDVKSFLNSEDYTSLSLLKEKTKAIASVEFALFQLWCQLSSYSDTLTFANAIKTNEVIPFSSWQNLNLNEIKNPNRKITFKIKCSNEELNDFLNDLDSKHKIHPKILNDYKLRIDGNTGWQALELICLWEELTKLGLSHVIDYFEEPLQNFQEYKKLLSSEFQKEIPIAHEEYLEEYLEEYMEDFLKTPQSYQNSRDTILVIKPSQWSLSRLFDLREQFKTARIVLSSAFELPEGINALKVLAQDLAPLETHGLGAKIPEKGIFREN